ncbi:MAG: HEAT repeat domain-containing protein [Cyanobacteriota bacterium]|nr:HEAT repeat domain-containing protein [Cyanobacteriota bacterium]
MPNLFNIYGLTEEEAIALLNTPTEELADATDRYVAVSHLASFPTQRSIDALIEAVQKQGPDLYDRITRRKAVESLGHLRPKEALPVVRSCLSDEDNYTVENAVWAIGEIGTEDGEILEEIAQLLDKPGQSYRIIIQTLAKLGYDSALGKIKGFVAAEDPAIVSAAIAAICRLRDDYSQMDRVVGFFQHPTVNVRRSAIQDAIDAQYYDAIPDIARCPVSIAFRLRGVRLLASGALSAGKMTFATVEPYLDRVIFDRPEDLELILEYDEKPSLDFLIQQLYNTDFGRCYKASKTLLELYPRETPNALLRTWEREARSDYGAHYHVIKLFGWLKYAPACDLMVEALNHTSPQFLKSRTAGAIALANLGEKKSIPLLKDALNTRSFDLKYACLLGLEMLGDKTGKEMLKEDKDELIQGKLLTI